MKTTHTTRIASFPNIENVNTLVLLFKRDYLEKSTLIWTHCVLESAVVRRGGAAGINLCVFLSPVPVHVPDY